VGAKRWLVAWGAMGAVLAAAAPARAQDEPVAERQMAFEAWIAAFKPQAVAAGVSAETVERELSGLAYNPRVVALDNAQPDRSAVSQATFAGYLRTRLNDARTNQGIRLRADLAATLSSIEAQRGVPGELLLAFWGMETAYGQRTGNFDLVRALATLAFDGRRRALFTAELIAALKLLDRGVIARNAFVGSWAGATGQPQFLPSSYLAHAADGNGDGRADIWNDRTDALASIASFVAAKYWTKGQPWAQRVYVPPGLDRERVRNLTPVGSCPGMNWRHSRWLSVKDWRALGVVPLGAPLPADATLATLIEPDGPGTGGYLTYGNYRAILRYNCTNYYALSVALLADAIRRGADRPLPPAPPPAGPDPAAPPAPDGMRGDPGAEPGGAGPGRG